MAEPDDQVADMAAEAVERGELPEVPASAGRRLTRRQKLARGGGAALAVLLAVAVLAAQLGVLRAPDVGALWRDAQAQIQLLGVPRLERATITPGQWQTAAGAGWEQIALPGADDGTLRFFWAAPDDAATVYACRGVAGRELDNPDVGPMTFWRTRDAGRTWQRLRTPPVTGRYCNVMTAPDAPRRVFAQAEDVSCASASALTSDDGGDTWRSNPLPPLPAHADQCQVNVWSTAHMLYVTYSARFNFRNVPCGKTTSCAVNDTVTAAYYSGDGGTSWTKERETRADSLHGDWPATPRFSPYSVQADGKREVQATYRLDERGATTETILWTTSDAGRNWHALGRLPDMYDPWPVLGARSVEPTRTHPIYLAQNTGDPALLFRVRIAQISDGTHWSALPPLPVPGATVDRLGITRLLGVTASGKPLALGVAPEERVPDAGDQSVLNHEPPGFGEHLWMWDAGAGRWTSYATPTPPSDRQCLDMCWDGQVSVGDGPDGQGTYLWLRRDIPGEVQALYRMYLPDV